MLLNTGYCSDEFELEFSEPSQGWGLNRADKFSILNTNHNQISYFRACILILINFIVIFMNLRKTIGIFRLECYTLDT